MLKIGQSSIAFLCLGIFLFSIAGLPRLSFTPDNRVFLDPTDQRVADLTRFEDTFGAANIVGIVVTCPPNSLNCQRLLPATIKELHQRSLSIPYVVRVESLDNHPVLASDENQVFSTSFLDKLCNPHCPEGTFKRSGTALTKRLANAKGETMAVFASLRFDTSETSAVFEIDNSLKRIESETILPPQATLHFVGRVPMMYAFVQASIDEIIGYMGLATLLIMILLVVTFGNISLACVSLGLSISTILTTFGIAGWFGFVVSLGSAALPTVILTLSTATAMHYFMNVVRVITEDSSRNIPSTAFGAARYQFTPTIITAATTVVAMLSMLLVDSPSFRDLGLWTAVSLPICCLYLFGLVPHVVARISNIRPSLWQTFLQPLLNRHARAAGKHWVTAIIVLVAATAATANISRLSVGDDLIRYFDADSRFRADAEHVASTLVGPTNIEVIVDAPSEIYDPLFLRATAQFIKDLRAHPHIDAVTSIIDVLDIHGEHVSPTHWTELDASGIAQLIFAYELSLSADQSTNDLISVDHSQLRISIVAKDLTSNEIIALEDWLNENTDLAGISATITGEAVPLAHLSQENIPNIAWSLFLTILGTSIVLGVYFRSIKLGAILFFTTVAPILCGFGIWTLSEDSIGMAATIILCICTGIVIDDTVHMVYRFHYAISQLGESRMNAISYAIHRVGNAICTTTLILVVGFGVLAFSKFEVNSAFGTCTVLVLVAAVLIDLLILPSLLTFSGAGSGKLQSPTVTVSNKGTRDGL